MISFSSKLIDMANRRFATLVRFVNIVTLVIFVGIINSRCGGIQQSFFRARIGPDGTAITQIDLKSVKRIASGQYLVEASSGGFSLGKPCSCRIVGTEEVGPAARCSVQVAPPKCKWTKTRNPLYVPGTYDSPWREHEECFYPTTATVTITNNEQPIDLEFELDCPLVFQGI